MGSLALASHRIYPGVPTFLEDEKEHRRLMASVINNILRGKMLPTGSITLTANSATTTLTDSAIGANSQIDMMATTANAGAELGAGIWFSGRVDGSCIIHHANNAQVDRTFNYTVIG